MKKVIIALFICSFFPIQLHSQDIIVKKDGTILNVYNVEESSSSYYYTLEPSSGSAVEKIPKEDVFSVKINGITSKQTDNSNTEKKASNFEREAVTANKVSEYVHKKKGRIIKASTPDGHVLDYAVLSETEHTLTVVEGEYKEKEYVIPEYVKINNIIYTVTEIDKYGFCCEKTVKKIQFPMTLKKIGMLAFAGCKIERILLPEGLEEICEKAFGSNSTQVLEIYIPSSVIKLGEYCFIYCGKNTSYRGFCQAYFSNMPAFITEGNCKSFGIDEVAVKEYQKNKK